MSPFWSAMSIQDGISERGSRCATGIVPKCKTDNLGSIIIIAAGGGSPVGSERDEVGKALLDRRHLAQPPKLLIAVRAARRWVIGDLLIHCSRIPR